MAARDGVAVLAGPAVDWLTIARDALDHIGLQGPAGVLLSDLWLETGCAASLVPHIWRVLRSHAELRVMTVQALVVNTEVPATRWDMAAVQEAGPAAAYGSFMRVDQLGVDRSLFGISVVEARSLDPQ